MPYAVDFLVRLMALAGHQHDVARAGLADRALDRRAPVALDHHRRAVLEALQDVGHDRVAVLAPRVVVGDDHRVGQAGGDARHLRALAAVALATTAEHAHDPAAGV